MMKTETKNQKKTKENSKAHNTNQPQIPDHPYKTLIIGVSIKSPIRY